MGQLSLGTKKLRTLFSSENRLSFLIVLKCLQLSRASVPAVPLSESLSFLLNLTIDRLSIPSGMASRVVVLIYVTVILYLRPTSPSKIPSSVRLHLREWSRKLRKPKLCMGQIQV